MRSPLRSLMIVALVGTAAAVPAWAQSSADTNGAGYPACTSKPTQADTEAAHGAYMAGKGSFDEADYTTAINYFRDAYRRDCTKNELLIIIARAYELGASGYISKPSLMHDLRAVLGNTLLYWSAMKRAPLGAVQPVWEGKGL